MAHNELSFQHHADIGFEAKADWQPISTAPTGEADVLGWRAGWETPVWCYWSDDHWRSYAIQGHSHSPEGLPPTHWYPVPPLPGG